MDTVAFTVFGYGVEYWLILSSFSGVLATAAYPILRRFAFRNGALEPKKIVGCSFSLAFLAMLVLSSILGYMKGYVAYRLLSSALVISFFVGVVSALTSYFQIKFSAKVP